VKRSILSHGAVPAALVLSLALAACGGEEEADDPATDTADETTDEEAGGELSGEVIVDGSSTVAPLSTAAGELFAQEEPGVNVSVATSGTGGGFEVFCLGETDISNASRPIDEDEIAACEENGIEYTELVVANDALSVVVSPDNDFAQCLSVEQLNTMWAPESEGTVTTWDQIDPSFPAEPLELYGAGTDSGTFDYFTESITGEEGASRSDYNATEDDNVTIQGVSGSAFAVGYLGFSYVVENEGAVRALEIDGGDGCVAPSPETVADGSYVPLARPLFIYVNNASYAERPEVAGFVDFYVASDAEIAEQADFIALADDQRAELESALEGLQSGASS
jgi:phosphate transport system substrate-binding protein